MDKKSVFEAFKAKTDEIITHYDEVEELKFTASLKNGTKFSFDYDVARFECTKKKESNSVVNGVCDIIAALACVAMLSISLVRGINSSIIVLQTLTFSFFIIFSILSAVYHLFSVNHQRTSGVLLLIRQFLLIVTLFLLTATITEFQQGSMFLILFFLLLSVLSLFLSLLSTKGGLRAGNIISAVIGVVLMLSFRDAYITFISLSIVINGLINALFDSDKTKLAGRVKTTSLFYLLSLLFFFLFSEHLLIAF